MKNRTILLFAATIALLAAGYCGESQAQDIPRYSPRRSTTSPYLNLLRNDTGPLPNYYSLVRPQLDQRSFDNRIASQTRMQGLAVQQLAIQQLSGASGRGIAAPTGSGSVFGNRSHYYRARRPFQR